MAEWTEEELALIERNLSTPVVDLMPLLPGRTPRAIQARMTIMRRDMRRASANEVREAALNPPIQVDKDTHIRNLEEEVARLRQQLTWAQHAESENRTGGVLTLRASDHHYGDANHLISCGLCLEAKAIEVFKIHQPDRINIVAGDDWIAGKGIYKEQDLDCVTSNTNEQCQVGAMHARRWLLRVREAGITAPILWHIMRGNHDYANGHSLTEYLHLMMERVCDDIEGVEFQMHWDRTILNLADQGTYNVLIRHGTGHSNLSPNSAGFISAVKDEILSLQQKMSPEKRIRRVLSGHTHWASLGLERVIDLEFDTTGGLQRNTRVKLGQNQRPVGWIVYVSPKGMDSNILQPIMLNPDREVYQREIDNPHLANENRNDAADRLKEYRDLMESKGAYAKNEYGGVNEGRQ